MRAPSSIVVQTSTPSRRWGRVLLCGLLGAGALAALGGCMDGWRADAVPASTAQGTTPATAPFIEQAPASTVCDRTAGRVLEVGPGKTYAVPSAAAAAAKDGDVVRIAAGDYRGDVAIWKASNLRLCGTGGLARLHAQGQSAEGKAIWLVTGANTVIDSVTFHGARVPDRNGAGIRAQHKQGDLRIVNCGFYDNENGILSSSGPVTITIERSEFARNSHGSKDGQTHNIYVGNIDLLMVSGSFFHETSYGHNFKSRAKVTLLENSYLMDGPSGLASYLADFPNGGRVLMRGNLLHKGPLAPNRVAIRFGAEGLRHPVNTLEMVHNTVVMTRPNSTFVHVTPDTQSVVFTANIWAASEENPMLLAGGVPAQRVQQRGDVQALASQLPGADHVLAPAFWPSDELLVRLLLPGALDSGYQRDAPAPLKPRAIGGTARLVGALQSRP